MLSDTMPAVSRDVRLELDHLRRECEELKSALAHVGEMRPGCLIARYRKCGKLTCHCAQEGSKGHGPSYSLTYSANGKTRTQIIPLGAVDLTRRQVSEYQWFRGLVRELITVSERICDLEIQLQRSRGK
jgi:hypothetical protein